jgi:cytidylate kinase
MPIIAISRGTFSGGQEFAENLAKKLGFPCLSREELSEKAIKEGVPVSKLQTAMIKPPRIAKRLGPERNFYLSYATSILCDYALKGDLVYHGHTGHQLLPGIPNILRIRILADLEHRIAYVMDKLNINRDKALNYIENVDADRDKWVKFLFGIDWSNPSQYDMIINLTQMNSSNAATALCNMADLPDFKLTPASFKAINNLKLANSARVLLCKDKRTQTADFKITADNGVVQVTCMPHQAEVAQYANEILQGLENCKSVRCTIAGSNILWLGEKFSVESEVFKNLLKVAKKWDAAIEVMRCAAEANGCESSPETQATSYRISEENGGIEDDVAENPVEDESGVDPVLDELQKEGCSGGISTIYGDKENLISNIAQHTNYSLVVIGNMFTSKTDSIRKRLTSELRSLLLDRLKSPVIGAEELKQELKMGFKEYFRIILYSAITLILFIGVFTNQEKVIEFLAGENYQSWRMFTILILLIFIPTFAYCYGNTARKILKIFKFE